MVEFEFTSDLGDFKLTPGSTILLFPMPGSYEIQETVPDGWDLVDADCTGPGTFSLSGSTLSLSLTSPGEVHCTFSNRERGLETPAPNRRPPNIGAGLSGLFAGQPTPLPTTVPAVVAPAAPAPIRPPNTGDGGLAQPDRGAQGLLVLAPVGSLVAAIALRRLYRA